MTMRRHTTPALALRGARLTVELRRRPGRVMPALRRRNPDGSSADPAAGLSDEMRWLWASLNITTEQRRAEELAHQARWYLQLGLEYDGDFDDLVERMEDDEETDKIIEAINERDPEWLTRWASEAASKMVAKYPTEAPSFLFFDNAEVVKNGWWVHFTNDARDIERRGFEYGESDPMQLGLTTWKEKGAKRGPGYVFSFSPRDAVHKNFGGRYGHGKYGNEAVLFRADAVVAYHHGDEEEQAISWGPEAEAIHVLRFENGRPGLDGEQPAREGIAGEYDDYNDVTYFDDIPTLIAYVEVGKKTNPRAHRSRR